MLKVLVQILIRQAKNANPSDPAFWLLTLQTANFNDLTEAGGVITSSAVNGSSFSVTIPAGFGPQDVLIATEQALQALETNTAPTSWAQGALR